jgi:zinc transport system permease protein
LTIPPYIAEKYARSLVQMMVASSLLGAVFTTTGLWLSYRYDLTSGATIILVAGVAFLVSLLIEKLRLYRMKREDRTSSHQ